MSRYRQFSYELPAPGKNQDKIFNFSAPAFVKPSEFLSIVNQYGKPKIHAVVDTSTEETLKQVLIVGTGQSIPDDLIDKVSKIGTLNFGDGQFGFHYYLVNELEEGFYKKIVISKRRSANYGDFESQRVGILQFVVRNSHVAAIETDDDIEDSEVIIVKLKDKEAGFEHTAQFKDFILSLYSSDLLDVSISNI